MLRECYPYFIGNEPIYANRDLPVVDKFSGKTATVAALARHDAIGRAIALASASRDQMRALKPHQRASILHHCLDRFEARFEELALTLCIETGKPIIHARGEVTRMMDTFRIAAEETLRIGGEVIPLEINPRADGYRGMTQRVPVGVCSFITPFNFPLNLVAHKVAPAIAAGCPFVLKPSEQAPLSALLIGEVLAETALPPGAFSVLPALREDAAPFATDERVQLLSFTGSPQVGWALKALAGRKKVTLELGGNAACIVDADSDPVAVAARIGIGAFHFAGQVCISVQRVIAHSVIYAQLRAALVDFARKLVVGDPRLESTFVGPMISEAEALRVERWIRSAVEAGATLLCGGERDGVMLTPAVLENVPKSHPLCAQEVFGPVVVLSAFDDFAAALDAVNDSDFGLQAGVFTRDLYKAQRAWDTLEVGAVVIGDIPTWRVDHMPYGGVKNSGFGREGVRYAIEEMTELRLLVIRALEP